MMDHRRQAGRFAAARGPGEQNQALLQISQPEERPWRAEIVQSEKFRGDGAKHHGGAVTVGEGIDPEPEPVIELIGKVDFLIRIEDIALIRAHELLDDRGHLFSGQPVLGDRLDFTVDPHHRAIAGGQMEI